MPTEQWRKEHVKKLRQYRRQWYASNKRHAKKKIIQRKEELKRWMDTLKETLQCNCGASHVAVLTFHHRDPKKKEIEVSRAVADGWSKERILKEIEKCDVLCRNCHAIIHWEENK